MGYMNLKHQEQEIGHLRKSWGKKKKARHFPEKISGKEIKCCEFGGVYGEDLGCGLWILEGESKKNGSFWEIQGYPEGSGDLRMVKKGEFVEENMGIEEEDERTISYIGKKYLPHWLSRKCDDKRRRKREEEETLRASSAQFIEKNCFFYYYFFISATFILCRISR
ncbi:uncharacterized protein G2W53_003286 [Senna tora]|uniref:Uncharacterized protein n=1 Tax=Senna tora TaxID=362788 RepID=A0A834XCT6_9FABA|nr:uncharacterized protein G2W53_003286 [Senna tora]